THFVLPSDVGEGQSKENVDEGSPGANATKEKAFVGLWNPGSRGHENQTTARFIGSAPRLCLRGLPTSLQARSARYECNCGCQVRRRKVGTNLKRALIALPE